eukprot:scaffold28302_cov129-Isochrysis_galbana.AAC.1
MPILDKTSCEQNFSAIMPSIQDDISRLVAIAKSSAGGKPLASMPGIKLTTKAPEQATPAAPSSDADAAPAVQGTVRALLKPGVKAEAATHVQTLLTAVTATVLVAAALTGSSLFLLPTYEIWRYQDVEGSRMGTLVLEKPAEIWPFGKDDGLLPGSDSNSNAAA